MIWMCIEIEKYKQAHNYDFSNYFDSSQIDDDAEALLNDFLSNPNYNLKLDKRKVPIIELAKIMGFKIYTAKFKDRNLSGTIGISKKLVNRYKSDKVIILNNQDTDEHILFTLCHELAHYIYDYESNAHNEYSNTYRTNEAINAKEMRANRFAASLLMPKESFKEAYSELSNNIDDKNIIVQGLSDAFNAPKTAVRIRMKEVLNV
ncbi:ImmA/IrrE family metallo-endopeptidase [Coprobacillus sp. AF33-1AC]|jgi:Zn-dependent peptidase ImmA (M78 family)|uniref:ImmA/IrrE family metallo-endopeptidase n=1 Tax=Coprobacillus sp. AF33-1AC TaxID=2292032 RepID=UPI000E3BFC38|nr:ImmA/IrrE family metallo-endopeptidase [Coprobacillus sp. AF33-1AC]RHM59309.1 ImmA/IrrE family metallo-endopeptidase [Coprobacillus sp. AF33-1AC]RHR85227.1 ImmA/IrrE family metallo-endopeptidase [Coprobacillus sp. AF15-30]